MGWRRGRARARRGALLRWGDLDAFAKSKNEAAKLRARRSCSGTGEAIVDSFDGFGFFLAEVKAPAAAICLS
jgi:hypothetical protein